MFQNMIPIVRSKLFFQGFQMDKDAKDANLSLKNNYGILKQKNYQYY